VQATGSHLIKAAQAFDQHYGRLRHYLDCLGRHHQQHDGKKEKKESGKQANQWFHDYLPAQAGRDAIEELLGKTISDVAGSLQTEVAVTSATALRSLLSRRETNQSCMSEPQRGRVGSVQTWLGFRCFSIAILNWSRGASSGNDCGG